ncbi:NB-ARC domain-containing protein [Laspinema sp. D1]|nr:NB-ARC domain-containing protein [Laspinema sp. D2b]
MEIQEAINWTDDRVFEKTGKHLDSLQRTILEGTLENLTYHQVAENYHCSKDHAKRVASELWRLLSDVLGEEVKKVNLKSILEQIEFSHISNFGSESTQIFGNINFCSELYSHPPSTQERSDTTTEHPSQPRYDLSEAPDVNRLYSRTEELATLKQWILAEHHRIVTITGLSGMGKTSLARQLVEEIKPNFERILWRPYRKYPNLNILKTDLIQFFSITPPSHNSILDYLRSHRCLIILDDFQELFKIGELAGNYRTDCQDYSKFIKQIATTPHNSCFLIIGWEKPIEIATLEGKNSPCRTLQLQGLSESSAQALLTELELTDTDRWGELITLYSGNPLWLNIASLTIQEIFDGSVADFLSVQTTFLGDLEIILNEHYQRLSNIEKQAVVGLASQEMAGHIFPDVTKMRLDEAEFLKAIKSLLRRGLIEKIKENGRSRFNIPPVIKEFVKHRL